MTNFPQASISATEVRVLHSAVASQDYLISVALPFHYDEHPEKVYPVIYVLDADLYFGMVVDMVRSMNSRVPFCNELPNTLIVGIGYPVTGSLAEREWNVSFHKSFFTQLQSRRYTDFTLTDQILANYTHCAMVPPAFQAGLVAVFS